MFVQVYCLHSQEFVLHLPETDVPSPAADEGVGVLVVQIPQSSYREIADLFCKERMVAAGIFRNVEDHEEVSVEAVESGKSYMDVGTESSIPTCHLW